MKTVLCPGSFDPITHGHLDIIRRAAALFDEVIVLVAENKDKHGFFTPQERMEMIRLATAEVPNVRVDYTDGLLIDYLRETGAEAVVKGLRAMSDFEYEFQMALTNRRLLAKCETIFLPAADESMYVSSSIVRQVCGMGGDISSFVPAVIHDEIVRKITGK